MALALNQSDLVDLGSLSIADYPFTLTGWFRVPDVSALLVLMRIKNTATGSYHALNYGGHSTGWASAISYVAVAGTAKSSVPMATEQWQHVAGVFVASNLRHVYLNGGNVGTATATRVFDGMDQSSVGNSSTSTAVDAAEVAVLGAALGADEIAALASGASVLSLPSAAAILTYKDFVRRVNHPPMTIVATSAGTPPVVDHPPVAMVSGGRATTAAYRVRGPWQLNQQMSRTHAARQGQLSVAGVVSDPTSLHGEVLS